MHQKTSKYVESFRVFQRISVPESVEILELYFDVFQPASSLMGRLGSTRMTSKSDSDRLGLMIDPIVSEMRLQALANRLMGKSPGKGVFFGGT